MGLGINPADFEPLPGILTVLVSSKSSGSPWPSAAICAARRSRWWLFGVTRDTVPSLVEAHRGKEKARDGARLAQRPRALIPARAAGPVFYPFVRGTPPRQGGHDHSVIAAVSAKALY